MNLQLEDALRLKVEIGEVEVVFAWAERRAVDGLLQAAASAR